MSRTPALLIIGDDPYLIATELEKALQGVDPLAIDEFGPGHDEDLVFQALGTPSMLGGERAVLVRDVHEFGSDFGRRVGDYLNDPDPSILLVMTSAKPLAKLATAVKSSGRVLEAGRGKRSDLFGWIKAEASTRKLGITSEGAAALIEAVGDERLALANALDELTISHPSGSRVGPKEVSRQFSGRTDVKLYGFIDAVASRQSHAALESLHLLLAKGEAPQMIFWSLVRHFRQMLIASDGSPGRVAGELGIPVWRAEKLVKQARGFSRTSLAQAVLVLVDGDRKIKKSMEPEELTLQRAVVEIAGA